jgi:ATP-binding cassette subfamily C (CFTR/MRP) protein 1
VVQIPNNLGWVLKMFAQAEVEFVAVERVSEYGRLAIEEVHEESAGRHATAVTGTGGAADNESQAFRGDIDFVNLFMRYRDGLLPTLKGVTMRVAAGSKVALLGRTGSGKSTLLLALSRFYEPCEGTIRFGGVDIRTLPLAQLRNHVGVIPQSGFLFGSTLRYALLGPAASRVSDEAVWSVLERVGVREAVSTLDVSIVRGGDQFSAGERQLLCLARALLRPTPILLCDEATSCVDVETDLLVHKAIFELEGTTVIEICHRLHHIDQFDVVVVLADGRVAEVGTPADLMANAQSELNQLRNAASRDCKKTPEGAK